MNTLTAIKRSTLCSSSDGRQQQDVELQFLNSTLKSAMEGSFSFLVSEKSRITFSLVLAIKRDRKIEKSKLFSLLLAAQFLKLIVNFINLVTSYNPFR